MDKQKEKDHEDGNKKIRRQTGGGEGPLLILVAIIGILALLSFISKNKPENVHTAMVESGMGFGDYSMKFDTIGEFNAADSLASGIQQNYGVSIPAEFIAEKFPSAAFGTFVLARLLSHGSARGLGGITSTHLPVRNNSVPNYYEQFIMRRGNTIGWISKKRCIHAALDKAGRLCFTLAVAA